MDEYLQTPTHIAEQLANALQLGSNCVAEINRHPLFSNAVDVFDATTLVRFKRMGGRLKEQYGALMAPLNAFYRLPPDEKQQVANAVYEAGYANPLMQNTCQAVLYRGDIVPLTGWLYLMSFCEQAALGKNCEAIQERAIPRSSKLAHDLLGCGHITIAIEADQNGKFTLHYQPESPAANPIPASLFGITLVQNNAKLTNIGRKTFVKLAPDAPLREVLSELAANQRQGKGLGGMTFCN